MSPRVVVEGPEGASIVVRVHERDGTLGEIVLWGDGADELVNAAELLALPAEPYVEPDGGVAFATIEVDDGVVITVDGVTWSHERVLAHLAGLLYSAVVAHATSVTSI